MINAWAPRVNTNIHLATLLCSTSGTDGMLMWPTPPCAAHALHASCTVPVRTPPPLQGLGAPSSTGCAGLCVRFGWRRGGGQWADHPGPHSGPKVWATRGVPHYGVHPSLSTLVGPFFSPGMPAHGVTSPWGGLHARTWRAAAREITCTTEYGVALMLVASAAVPKLLFYKCPCTVLEKSGAPRMMQVSAASMRAPNAQHAAGPSWRASAARCALPHEKAHQSSIIIMATMRPHTECLCDLACWG